MYPIWSAVENLEFVFAIRGKQHRTIGTRLGHDVCSRFPDDSDVGGMRLIAENFLEILDDAVQFTYLFFGFFAPAPQGFDVTGTTRYRQDARRWGPSKVGGGGTRFAANKGGFIDNRQVVRLRAYSRRGRYHRRTGGCFRPG